MHRSGTSWLTGSLQHAGLELGEVNTVAQHNLKGNRENEFLQQLHESVLESNGGSWRKPSWPNTWSAEQSAKLAAHVAAMSRAHRLWGFKDPRALLMLDEWHRQVGDLVRIGIYRHPMSVYRSLKSRHRDFKKREAVGLWNTYNERLLDEHRRHPFPIVRFDVSPEELRAQLRQACRELDLEDPTASEAFFDSSLVHNETDDGRVPRSAADMWLALGEAAMKVTA
jgi:hypothetical protein